MGRGIKCRRKEKHCSVGFVYQSCSYLCKEDGRLGEVHEGQMDQKDAMGKVYNS